MRWRPDEQIRRVVPVIGALARQVDVPISIDTCDADVARAALAAGATIINDITALSDDRVTASGGRSAGARSLMHMQGTPATMQTEPHYDDVVGEVLHFLLARAQHAESRDIPRERIILDPGIGFGKTLQHNLALLKHIDRIVAPVTASSWGPVASVSSDTSRIERARPIASTERPRRLRYAPRPGWTSSAFTTWLRCMMSSASPPQ